MTEMKDIKRNYYIIDTFGNYYCLNGSNELVSAPGIEEAGIFSYLEATAKLSDRKRSRFYKMVPVSGECLKKEASKRMMSLSPDSGLSNQQQPEGKLFKDVADLAEVDWVELMTNLVYINTMLPAYKEKLQADLSETELLIIDLMHFIEIYEYDDRKALEIMERIREAREKRRIIKNEIFRVDCFRNAIGSNANAAKVKEALKQIHGKENGSYRPRVDGSLFEHQEQKPRKLHHCYAEQDYTALRIPAVINEETEILPEVKTMEREYIRMGTVYDERQPDWLEFVKAQAEFFQNAEQHLIDLHCDLESIDAAIEEALLSLEDANYNVTQGYRAFKELKDLRNDRRAVMNELQLVRMIADRFDCKTMFETYESIEAEMMQMREPAELISGNPQIAG